ncbi:MAG: polysaccharide biosynthesis/export family protein [Candidatus Binatia bacterium]
MNFTPATTGRATGARRRAEAAALACLVLLAAVASACSAPLARPGVPPLPPPVPAANYAIQVGDTLAVKFYKNPSMNEEVAVRPDGMISLEIIHDVPAAGLSPEDLTADLKRRYAKELADPEISVIIKTLGGQRIYVGGEVGSQGAMPLNGGLTMFQAIQQAGGFTKTARRDEVVLIRTDVEGQRTAYKIDLEKVQSGASPEADVPLRPYDVVFVPRSTVGDLNVWVEQYIRNNLPINPSMGLPII